MSNIDTRPTGRAALPMEIDSDQEPLTLEDRDAAAELTVSDLTALDWDGSGSFIGGGALESITHDNTRRAGFALHGVEAYADVTGGIASEGMMMMLTDLLGDMMHLADALGVDFFELVRRGGYRYEAETRGQR
jgi:hypothetical protein